MANTETITFKRLISRNIKEILSSGRSLLLLGPRQTGKTTLLREVFAEFSQTTDFPPFLSYFLQLPSTRQRFEADPEILIREVEAAQAKNTQKKPIAVWIDEIQLVPSLMGVLQFLIDEKKITLAASGSSARKMRKMGANWLPGRIHLMHLAPLTWEENQSGRVGSSHSLEELGPNSREYTRLDEALLYGGLPGVAQLKDPAERARMLSSYEQLYLEEEIRMEAAVRNLPRFRNFLRLAAMESGSSPNLSKIGSQVELSHTSIRSYYQILEDTLVVHRIDALGTSRDQVLRSPRYYFFDLGVRNATAGIGHSPGILVLQRGLLFENWVVLEAIGRLKDKASFYYWRTKQGEEVDLIIEREGKRWAIEVKSTESPSLNDFKGLEAFSKKHKCDEGWVVCQIPRPQSFGKFKAIPWFEFGPLLEQN